MRLKYYDKHDTEIQVGMLLRHDDGAIERVLECIILSVKNSTWTHRRICT